MPGDEEVPYQEIVDGDWDYLIILDACRFDYFERQYSKYLHGKLEKRLSRGSCTAEWLYRTFTRKLDDVVYISTNPFVNNKNLPLNRTIKDCSSRWNPTANFKKIVDVWLDEWNHNISTVLPEKVNKAVKQNLGKNRLIIHYIQPHEPYLTHKENTKDWVARETISKTSQNKLKEKMWSIARPVIVPIWHNLKFSQRIKIKKVLGMKMGVFENLYAQGRIDELKKYYEDNLDIVLKHVAELVNELDGKIIITSDHGEAFGENGDWSHRYGSNNPVLREVPWLEINKKKTVRTKIKSDLQRLRT